MKQNPVPKRPNRFINPFLLRMNSPVAKWPLTQKGRLWQWRSTKKWMLLFETLGLQLRVVDIVRVRVNCKHYGHCWCDKTTTTHSSQLFPRISAQTCTRNVCCDMMRQRLLSWFYDTTCEKDSYCEYRINDWTLKIVMNYKRLFFMNYMWAGLFVQQVYCSPASSISPILETQAMK